MKVAKPFQGPAHEARRPSEDLPSRAGARKSSEANCCREIINDAE